MVHCVPLCESSLSCPFGMKPPQSGNKVRAENQKHFDGKFSSTPTITSYTQALVYTEIQGGTSIPSSTIPISISTYTSTQPTTTIQPTRGVNTSLGISTRNPSSCVHLSTISPQPSSLTNLQFTFSPHTYTTPPYSPPPYNNNDSLLNKLFQSMTSL